MKTLLTRNGSYLTGTEIADAVMRYGLALSKKHDVDVVDVPFVATDSSIHRAEFTIGWQTDLVAISDAEPTDELLEGDTIVDLYSRARALGAIQARAFTQEETADLQWAENYGDGF